MKNIYYVYILFKPWNGEPFYVGKGKGKRWLQHEHEKKHYNPVMHRILEKARKLGLEIPKAKIRENLTESEAFEIESAFIRAIGRNQNGGPLANNTDGGEGVSGYKFPLEIVERIRKKSTGRKCDPEWCANVSKSLVGNKRCVGRVNSPETRARMGASQKARWEDPEYRAKMLAIRADQFTDEYRKNRSELTLAQLGRSA